MKDHRRDRDVGQTQALELTLVVLLLSLAPLVLMSTACSIAP